MKLVLKEDLLYTGGCLLCKTYEDTAEIDSRYTRDPDVDVLTVEGEEALNIPEGVEAIGPDAFSECPKLAAVTLPSTLNAMESTALRGVRSLQVAPSNRKYRMEDGFLIEKSPRGDCLLWVPEEQEIVKIPDSVERIASGVFQYNFNVRAVYLPEKLEQVAPRQFRRCRSLQRVFLSKHLRVVAKDAFVNCDALRVVVMENPLTFLTHDMKGEREEGDAFNGVDGFFVFSEENLWMTHYLQRHQCRRYPLSAAQPIRALDDMETMETEEREEKIRQYLTVL